MKGILNNVTAQNDPPLHNSVPLYSSPGSLQSLLLNIEDHEQNQCRVKLGRFKVEFGHVLDQGLRWLLRACLFHSFRHWFMEWRMRIARKFKYQILEFFFHIFIVNMQRLQGHWFCKEKESLLLHRQIENQTSYVVSYGTQAKDEIRNYPRLCQLHFVLQHVHQALGGWPELPPCWPYIP